MAETQKKKKFSLFADSCANSSNKKSMNQGSQYIPITKIERFVTSPLSGLFISLLFMKTCLFSLAREELWVVGEGHKQPHSLLEKKKGEIFEKCLHPHLKRRHLTVTNQIHSVIEFPISAKLIRERKHNNSEWHISEGGDFKEQHQGTPEPPLAEFLHKYAVKQYDVLLLPESMLRARVGSI